MTFDASIGLAGLTGGGIGLGLFLIVRGLTPDTRSPAPRVRRVRRVQRRRVALVVVVGVTVFLLTRWPVAGVLAAAAVWFAPAMLGPDHSAASAVARGEAIAAWAEMLRDTLQAAAGLEQALLATAPVVPAVIQPEVQALAGRIRAGQRLPGALRAAADDFDDPTADLVLAALLQAAEHQARQLGPLLTDLADAAHQQATVRLRQSAERARTRTSVRVITATTLTMTAGLALFNRTYLQPYDTVLGQCVLAAVGALFGAGLWWLSRLSRPFTPDRHLALTARGGGR